MSTVGSYAAWLAGNVVLGNFTLFLTFFIGIRFLIKPDTSRENTIDKGEKLDQKGVAISLFFGLTIGFGTGFVGTGTDCIGQSYYHPPSNCSGTLGCLAALYGYCNCDLSCFRTVCQSGKKQYGWTCDRSRAYCAWCCHAAVTTVAWGIFGKPYDAATAILMWETGDAAAAMFMVSLLCCFCFPHKWERVWAKREMIIKNKI